MLVDQALVRLGVLGDFSLERGDGGPALLGSGSELSSKTINVSLESLGDSLDD